ncbi:MAG: DNA primase [Desulfurivibrionaceae bacterium]|nr:DNA primase [Desulfurivibrionaceae bacterium]
MIPFKDKDDSVRLVKEAADIVEIIGEHVNLKKAGANYKGRCPFHSEKTPSFTVNRARGSFHCFGCNEGGDIFSFYMKYHNATFPEALKGLAKRYGVALPEKPLSHADQARAQLRSGLYEVLERSGVVFHEILLGDPCGAPAREYLASRNIPDGIIRKFRLGYAPDSWNFLTDKITDPKQRELAAEAGLIVKKERGGFYDRFRDRLLCPITDMTGQIAGFSGRILGDGQPKYMNSPENPVFDKGRLLFGLFQNRESIRKRGLCLLVEGNFDLLALVAGGLDYAAAPLGTALTRAQVRSLKGYANEVIILFDGDEAGLKAAMRGVPLFLSEQVAARVCTLPKGHDPDTFLGEYGRASLETKLQEATSLPEFVFAQLTEKYGLGLEGKTKIAAELHGIARELGDNQLQKDIFIAHFSRKLGISLDQLKTLPPRVLSPARPEPSRAGEPTDPENLPFKQKQLLEFLIIFPEYLQKFLEAGIEQVVVNEVGQNILRHLQEFTEEGNGGLDRLLDLAEGPEKSFISRLLISSPSFSDEDREQTAAEQTAWLEKTRRKGLEERLTSRIKAAQQAGNIELCLELIARKNELDRITD